MPWLVTAELPKLDPRVHERVLFGAIALDFLFFVLFIGVPWMVVARIVRRKRGAAERKLEHHMRKRASRPTR